MYNPNMSKDSNNLSNWIANFPQKSLSHKTTLLEPCDEITNIYAIESGFLKMSHLDESGNQVIITIIAPNSFIPLPTALLGKPNDFDFETLTPVSARIIPKSEFINKIKNDHVFLFQIFYKFLSGFEVLTQQLSALKHNHSDSKIQVILDQLSNRGEKHEDFARFLHHMNQNDLAELAGVSRETLSRFLSKQQLQK